MPYSPESQMNFLPVAAGGGGGMNQGALGQATGDEELRKRMMLAQLLKQQQTQQNPQQNGNPQNPMQPAVPYDPLQALNQVGQGAVQGALGQKKKPGMGLNGMDVDNGMMG